MHKRWLVLGVVGACTDVSSHPVASAVGASGSSIVWADATGERVPGAIGLNEPMFVEADGSIWRLDPSLAMLSTVAGFAELGFASTDCSGPALASGPPAPRITFYMVTEVGLEIRTVHDDAAYVTARVCSKQNAGDGCGLLSQDTQGNPICELWRYVTLESTSSRLLPVLEVATPLHPILVGS